MPNRGELPPPAARARAAAPTSMPNTDAWMVIGFCAVGWLAAFYMALTTAGPDALPMMLTQIPIG